MYYQKIRGCNIEKIKNTITAMIPNDKKTQRKIINDNFLAFSAFMVFRFSHMVTASLVAGNKVGTKSKNAGIKITIKSNISK